MKIQLTLFCFAIFLAAHAQYDMKTPILEVKQSTPDWAINLKTLNLGDYNSYLLQEVPKEEIIGFIGDQYQRPINRKTPFTNFFS